MGKAHSDVREEEGREVGDADLPGAVSPRDAAAHDACSNKSGHVQSVCQLEQCGLVRLTALPALSYKPSHKQLAMR